MHLRVFLNSKRVETAPAGHRHTRIGWVNVDCPHCGPGTRKWHLGISEDELTANCWKCGPKNGWEILRELTGISFSDIPHTITTEKVLTKQDIYVGRKTIQTPHGIVDFLDAHKDYLIKRNFDPHQIAKLWGVKGIGIHPYLSWRLWIPIFQKGKAVSYTTRTIGNANPRYRNAKPNHEVVPIKQTIYGANLARHSVVICEGPTDVWRFGPGAVCTFGVQYTQPQLEILRKFPIRAVCFDNEIEAQERADNLVQQLKNYTGKTFLIKLDSKDMDTATQSEINQIKRCLS